MHSLIQMNVETLYQNLTIQTITFHIIATKIKLNLKQQRLMPIKTTSTTANLKAQFKTFPTIEIKNYLKDYTNKFELSRTPTKMNEIDLNDESKDLFFNSQSLAVHQIGPRSGSSKDALTIKLNKKLQHLFIRYNSKDQSHFFVYILPMISLAMI